MGQYHFFPLKKILIIKNSLACPGALAHMGPPRLQLWPACALICTSMANMLVNGDVFAHSTRMVQH